MLQEKYLPQCHFTEKYSVVISQPAEEIYALVDQLDFSESIIIRMLFTLRGMPARMMNKQGLQNDRFVVLEQQQNREIIIGLIGQFWRPSGNLQKFYPHEFVLFTKPGFCKATWNFRLTSQTAKTTMLETETRIFCLDERTKKKFSGYWFFIRPFSGIIRKEILRLIKKKAEA